MKTEKRYIGLANPLKNGSSGSFHVCVMETTVVEESDSLSNSVEPISSQADASRNGISRTARLSTMLRRLFPKPLSRKVA